MDKPADSDALALDALKDGDNDEEAVLVPLPHEYSIDLYLCPVTYWWSIGHRVTYEVIELSASDHSWAVEYDEAGFATAVRDDDGPDNKQAYQVIDLMEVGAFYMTPEGHIEWLHCFVENFQIGNFDNQLELMRKHIIRVARMLKSSGF